jgi:hypothetical protein
LIERSDALVHTLETAEAELGGNHRATVVAATRELRSEVRALKVIELELVHAAFTSDGEQHLDIRPARAHYDALRRDDPLLLSWPDAVSGRALRRAQLELMRLANDATAR